MFLVSIVEHMLDAIPVMDVPVKYQNSVYKNNHSLIVSFSLMYFIRNRVVLFSELDIYNYMI